VHSPNATFWVSVYYPGVCFVGSYENGHQSVSKCILSVGLKQLQPRHLFQISTSVPILSQNSTPFRVWDITALHVRVNIPIPQGLKNVIALIIVPPSLSSFIPIPVTLQSKHKSSPHITPPSTCKHTRGPTQHPPSHNNIQNT